MLFNFLFILIFKLTHKISIIYKLKVNKVKYKKGGKNKLIKPPKIIFKTNNK